jgi:hypothetical protein
MKLKLILSIPTLSLLASTAAIATPSICVKSDSNYRINYHPGDKTLHNITPGEMLVNLPSDQNTLYDWSGNLIGTIPTVNSKQEVVISQSKISTATLDHACGNNPNPGPGPTPSAGKPALPGDFKLTKAADSDTKNPSVGKEYVQVQYNMWWGNQTHYLDILQDGKKICLNDAGKTIPTDCEHSYTFTNYTKGSQQAQNATLEFGPTTITKHKYALTLTNDAGQSSKTYDLNLAPAGQAVTSVFTVSPVDTANEKRPNIVISQANTKYHFNIEDSDTSNKSNSFQLAWSNPGILSKAPSSTDSNGNFTVMTKNDDPGRTSLRITDSVGNVRYIGLTITNNAFAKDPSKSTPKERLNAALPPYVAIGSMTEDNTGAINYWRHFDSSNAKKNRRVDIRYIYLNQWSNGNPGGWADREKSFVKNGLELGQMPFFVEYNVNGGGDSQEQVYNNLQDPKFMAEYFTHLAEAAQYAHQLSGNAPVGFIIEPDMLGYMLHDLKKSVTMPAAGLSALASLKAPQDMSKINVPYSQQQNIPKSQALIDPSIKIDNTLQGFVKAVNYVLWKYSGQTAVVGWQMNLWASPDNSANGIIHESRDVVIKNAQALAKQGQDLGIRPNTTTALWDTSFISIDKYGLDGAGYNEGYKKPAESTWFWNANLYDNYLAFASTLAYPNISGVTNLPIVLWQLPVGHLNGSQESSPYTGVPFRNLQNISTSYEGSSAPYFLGENFHVGRDSGGTSDEQVKCKVNGKTMPYFACPDNYNGVSVSGSSVSWKNHMQEAANSHVAAILFGAGIGASTHGHPISNNTSVTNKTADPDTYADTPDDNWFVTHVQDYYKNPVKREK